jgi:hypothetical protein
MNLFLKIKIKSLVAEAGIIRVQEQRQLGFAAKCKNEEYRDQHETSARRLKGHRKGVVRNEMRQSLLAYGFLNAKPYKCMEATCRSNNKPNWDTIEKMAIRFGHDQRQVKQRFAEWKEEATKE